MRLDPEITGWVVMFSAPFIGLGVAAEFNSWLTGSALTLAIIWLGAAIAAEDNLW